MTTRLPVVLCCLIIHVPAARALGQDAAKTASPEQTVRIFYEALYSNQPVKDCPKIFYEANVLAGALPTRYQNNGDGSAAVWAFFRDHKNALGFGGPDPLIRAQRARLGYLFTSYRDGAPFFEGGFSIVAMHTISPGGKEGIWKEVVFPMQKSGPAGPPYLIDPIGIKINGVVLATSSSEFSRSDDLWRLLGFR